MSRISFRRFAAAALLALTALGVPRAAATTPLAPPAGAEAVTHLDAPAVSVPDRPAFELATAAPVSEVEAAAGRGLLARIACVACVGGIVGAGATTLAGALLVIATFPEIGAGCAIACALWHA